MAVEAVAKAPTGQFEIFAHGQRVDAAARDCQSRRDGWCGCGRTPWRRRRATASAPPGNAPIDVKAGIVGRSLTWVRQRMKSQRRKPVYEPLREMGELGFPSSRRDY